MIIRPVPVSPVYITSHSSTCPHWLIRRPEAWPSKNCHGRHCLHFPLVCEAWKAGTDVIQSVKKPTLSNFKSGVSERPIAFNCFEKGRETFVATWGHARKKEICITYVSARHQTIGETSQNFSAVRKAMKKPARGLTRDLDGALVLKSYWNVTTADFSAKFPITRQPTGKGE